MSTDPERPRTTGGGADLHYNRIKDDLLSGVYPPETVLFETTLSQHYGVSRTPVREALGRLAQDGYIERVSRGFLVRKRTPEEILAIYEARITLESTAAALAARRRTDFDLRRLSHLAEQRRESAAAGRAELTKLNDAWHRALREAAHNDVIGDLLGRLDGLLAIYRPARPWSPETDPTIQEHDEITDAVREADAPRAERAMSAHLARMRDLRVEGLARDHS